MQESTAGAASFLKMSELAATENWSLQKWKVNTMCSFLFLVTKNTTYGFVDNTTPFFSWFSLVNLTFKAGKFQILLILLPLCFSRFSADLHSADWNRKQKSKSSIFKSSPKTHFDSSKNSGMIRNIKNIYFLLCLMCFTYIFQTQ